MKFARSQVLSILLMLSLCFTAAEATADTVHVAVAANFASTLKLIAQLFKVQTGHEVVISSGASGQLYAQIKAHAPFAIFLSADEARPQQLEAEGLVEPFSRFTYAVGRLLLWSPKQPVVDAQGKPQLGTGRIALAEPRTAPYGAAAASWLETQHKYKELQQQRRLVVGTSITQTLQFIESGAAPVGFVALSQVIQKDGTIRGHGWTVPGADRNLKQAAVLLKRHAHEPAAKALMAFLRSPQAARVIEQAGYGLPNGK